MRRGTFAVWPASAGSVGGGGSGGGVWPVTWARAGFATASENASAHAYPRSRRERAAKHAIIASCPLAILRTCEVPMNASGIRKQVLPLALLIAAALTITTGDRAGVQGVVRKVYVTVLDKDDNPVVDMKAAEF